MIPDQFSGGPRFAAFSEHYLRHTKGRWAGQPVIYEGWQREFLWEALEIDPATGLRVYTEVGLGIPRKNGKSTKASATGLYFLTADGEPEPEVYVAAGARQQAGIVLGQSRSMALRSGPLLDHVRVFRYLIECPRNGGIMRALSADAGLQHGLNPSANLIDELHAHKTPDLYIALTTGTGAREEPFTLWITTAGVAGDGILYDLYRQMFDGPGVLEDRGNLQIYRDRENGILIYWFGAPRHADIEDPAVWLATNPASWLQDGKYLKRQFNGLKAKNKLLEWKRYHLNMFVDTEETWLPEGAWSDLPGEPVLRDDLPVGVAIFKQPDSSAAAVAVAQRQGDKMAVIWRPFHAQSATGRVSTDAIREYLRELRGRFPKAQARDPKTHVALRGPAYAYDKWAFQESAEELDNEGLHMVDFGQIASTMGPASTAAYELITTGRIVHEHDPVLAEHIASSAAVLTDRGMRVVPNRKKANHGAIAVIMAVAMAQLEAPPPVKERKTHGF